MLETLLNEAAGLCLQLFQKKRLWRRCPHLHFTKGLIEHLWWLLPDLQILFAFILICLIWLLLNIFESEHLKI